MGKIKGVKKFGIIIYLDFGYAPIIVFICTINWSKLPKTQHGTIATFCQYNFLSTFVQCVIMSCATRQKIR